MVEISALPESMIRPTRIGDPWVDVFLWGSDVFVGTPVELWDKLADRNAELSKNAPLTLLDVATCVKTANRADLVRSAFAFMKRRFGLSKALIWRRETYLGGELRKHLWAALNPAPFSTIARSIYEAEVNERSDRVVALTVPRAILEADKATPLNGLIESMRLVLSPLNLTLGEVLAPSTGQTVDIVEKARPNEKSFRRKV